MTRERLRDIRIRRRDDADVMTLLWEVRRLRETLLLVRGYYEVINQQWSEEVGGQLAALYQLKRLLGDEPAIIERKMDQGTHSRSAKSDPRSDK